MTANSQVVYVDSNGRLTIAGMQLIQNMARDIETLKAQVADHEARISVLEP